MENLLRERKKNSKNLDIKITKLFLYNKMSYFKKYIEYLKDNPEGYWFKRKLYGWGWTPVKWQGWLVTLIGVVICITGVYIGETDDAPGAALIGVLLMIALILFFGFWKGEKPRWRWGSDKRML